MASSCWTEEDFNQPIINHLSVGANFFYFDIVFGTIGKLACGYYETRILDLLGQLIEADPPASQKRISYIV